MGVTGSRIWKLCALAVCLTNGMHAENLLGGTGFLHDLNGLNVIAVVSDPNTGDEIVAGVATKDGLPAFPVAIQPHYFNSFCGTIPGPGSAANPCGDVYVARFSLPGRLVSGTYLGGSGADTLGGIALDAAGNLYLLGTSRSADFPIPLAVLGGSTSTRTGAFVIQLRRDGTLGFARALPINQDATPTKLAVSGGSIYVAGTGFAGSVATTPGVLQPQAAATGQADGFLVKLDTATGSIVYATYLGGSQTETLNGLAADAAGNAYVAGSTQSKDYPVTAGAWHQVAPGTSLQSSIFVSVVNASGSGLAASAVFGGESNDSADQLVLAPNGDILLAGVSASKSFPVTPGALRAENFGPPSAFLTRLPPDLSSPVFSTFLDRDTQVAMLAEDTDGTIVLVGNTQSRFFPLTHNAKERCFASGFLARLSGDGTTLIYGSFFKISNNSFQLTHATLAPNGNLLISALSAGYDLTFYQGSSVAAGPNDPPTAFMFRFGPGFGSVLSRFCAVNSASLDPALTYTGELITLFGSSLLGNILADSPTGEAGHPDADRRYPLELGGIQVRIGGQLAGLLFASSDQVNASAPALSPTGDPVSIELLRGGQVVASTTARLLENAPGLFRAGDTQQAAAVNEDGSGNNADHQARAGSRLTLFGTGFGATSPPQDQRVAAGTPRPLATPLKIYVNSVEASVLFAGQAVSAPPGLIQIDIVVPDVPAAGSYPVNFLLGTAFQLGLADVWVNPR
jgi:uncharacterized protein (TIGR03437 family)